MRSIGLDDK